MTLTKQQKAAIKKDFREWDGNILDNEGPQSRNDITVYVDYAMDANLNKDEVYGFLREWMAETTGG